MEPVRRKPLAFAADAVSETLPRTGKGDEMLVTDELTRFSAVLRGSLQPVDSDAASSDPNVAVKL
jgi:hypothetical protein